MVTVRWALRHPDGPGIVNLDGLRSAETAPRHYLDIGQDELGALLAELKAVFDAQAEATAQPLPEAHAAMYPQRALRTPDGGVFVRPDAALARQIRYDPYVQDSVPAVADIRCPALFVLATDNLPGLTGRVGELMPALRAGIRHDLSLLTADRPHLRVLELAASHTMVAEQPDSPNRSPRPCWRSVHRPPSKRGVHKGACGCCRRPSPVPGRPVRTARG